MIRETRSPFRDPVEYYLLLRGWARSDSIDWHPFFLNGRRTYASATVVSRIGASALPTKTTLRSGQREKSHISALFRRRDASSRGPTFIGRRTPSSTDEKTDSKKKRRPSRAPNGSLNPSVADRDDVPRPEVGGRAD